MPKRLYEESHPWITFEATDFNDLTRKQWMLLGEAKSKCEHLAGTPLQPVVARQLYDLTLVKSAQATTAIEGNSLTEEQVAGIYRGTFKAPPSRAYQEREVKNVIDTLDMIEDQVKKGHTPQITPKLICDFNRQVLDGTEYESNVIPGTVRDYSVVVGAYRGAPAEDCTYLLEQLAEWLEGEAFKSGDPEIQFALVITSAIYAHLYIAWIHPFGDGNGRTARLLEFLILARCGMVPVPTAHLLSNHYNLTRDQYYRELGKASRTSKATELLGYATQGLVDGIQEQIESVREQQFSVAWTDYVHETMGQFVSSPTKDRQRSLVLAMPSEQVVQLSDLPRLTPELAALYAKTGARTLNRDLNRLRDVGLMVKEPQGWKSNEEIMKAFLPPIAESNQAT